MMVRHASINDLPIREEDRKFRWPLGRRPDDHRGLSSFGFQRNEASILHEIEFAAIFSLTASSP
jgi:hypothetical protein